MPDLFVLPLRLQSHLVALEPFGSRLGFLDSFRGHWMRRNSKEGSPVVTQAWLGDACPRLIHRSSEAYLAADFSKSASRGAATSREYALCTLFRPARPNSSRSAGWLRS